MAALILCLAAPRLSALEWVKGAVELSDGTRVAGQVYIVGGSFFIFNEAQKKRYAVRTEEVRKLEARVEKEYMAGKWFFKEDGRDEKVYTGEKYPVRHYVHRVTFHDGRSLTGHIIAKTIYVKSDGKPRRFMLRRKDEGIVEESLDDLLYVREVSFEEGEGGVLGTIGGGVRLPAGEKIERILAVSRENEFILQGRIGGTPPRFQFSGCTAGTYDLVVVSDRAIYAYFSREKDQDCARLTRSPLAEIQQWADKVREFFHKQELLYAAGNPELTFALVCKERYGGTTLQGAELVRRIEVWVMHRPEEEWQIRKRMFVWRLVSKKKRAPRKEIIISPQLGGHEVNVANRDLELELELGPTGEAPIPSDPERGRKKDGQGS